MDILEKSTEQSHRRNWHNRPKKRDKLKRADPEPTGGYGWLDQAKTKLGRYMQLYVMVDGERRRDGEAILEPIQWSNHNHRLYTRDKGVKWWAHELAWVVEHGVMPGKLRFKDGNTQNYSIHNLVERGPAKPHQAQVRVGSEIRCLGSYVTKAEAVATQDAYKALVRLGIV